MMEPFWNLWSSSVYIGLVVLYCSDYSNIYDICNTTWYYHIIDVYCILISISYIIIIPSTIIYSTNIFIIFHSKLEARRLWHSLYHVTTLSCKISCTSNVHEDAITNGSNCATFKLQKAPRDPKDNVQILQSTARDHLSPSPEPLAEASGIRHLN